MTEKLYDVAALGELIVQFTEADGRFTASPCGSQANTLAMLRKLGMRCAFIGKVGRDEFGERLVRALDALGIDTGGVLRDGRVKTTLAFSLLGQGGERTFSLYREQRADMMLRAGEVSGEIIDSCRIFHFGTLSMTEEPAKTATVEAVERAKRSGALISFDPNLRPEVWRSAEEATMAMSYGLSVADILKISDRELEFLIGETDIDYGGRKLQTVYPNLRLINLTSAAGSCAIRGAASAFEPAYDTGTAGAADAFCGAMLSAVAERGFDFDLREALRFADRAAYIAASRPSAPMQMPERSEIEALMRKS